MTGTAAAQIEANDTEESEVTVGVSSTIAVDVQPANLDYSGAVVGNRNTSSDRGFGAIEIDNTGSEYINRIWLNTSIPSSDPYGTGTASSYNAGNFLEVKPDSSGTVLTGDESVWHPVNKKVFMVSNDDPNGNSDTNVPSFIQVPDSNWDPYEAGRIRRGNESIYFAIGGETDNTCSGSGSDVVRVGNVSQTDTRLGTVDFTSSTEYGWTEYSLNQVTGNSYGITADGVNLNWTYSSGDEQVDLLTKCDDTNEQPNVIANKYNPTVEGADDLTSGNGQNTQYLLEETSGTTGNMLAPGNTVTVNTAIDVPLGVAEGSVDPGNLRVLITADTDAN